MTIPPMLRVTSEKSRKAISSALEYRPLKLAPDPFTNVIEEVNEPNDNVPARALGCAVGFIRNNEYKRNSPVHKGMSEFLLKNPLSFRLEFEPARIRIDGTGWVVQMLPHDEKASGLNCAPG